MVMLKRMELAEWLRENREGKLTVCALRIEEGAEGREYEHLQRCFFPLSKPIPPICGAVGTWILVHTNNFCTFPSYS